MLPPLYSSCYPQLPARAPSSLVSANFTGDKKFLPILQVTKLFLGETGLMMMMIISEVGFD